MSNSEVPRIELSPDGSTLTLYVSVDGFAPGTPVEISGYATQDNGAIVTFYDIQQIPNGTGQTSAAWGGPAAPAAGAPAAPAAGTPTTPAASGPAAPAASGQQTPASAQGVIFRVRAVSVPPLTFNPERPIVVIARAADVWITKLDKVSITAPTSKEITAAKTSLAEIEKQKGIQPAPHPKAAWNSDEKVYRSALTPS
jgi:hypothetical protein